jgi:hypothetical protein
MSLRAWNSKVEVFEAETPQAGKAVEYWIGHEGFFPTTLPLTYTY